MSDRVNELRALLSQHGQIGYDDIEGCECGFDDPGAWAYYLHLAKVVVAHDEAIRAEEREELDGLAVKVRREIGKMPWVSVQRRGVTLAEGYLEGPRLARTTDTKDGADHAK